MTRAFGVDIGRTRDVTVILGGEQISDDEAVYVRYLEPMERHSFQLQETKLDSAIRAHQPDAVVIDQNGIGMQLAETFAMKYGSMVTAFNETDKTKADLVSLGIEYISSKKVRVPAKWRPIVEELSAIRAELTIANRKLYRDQPHGDMSWAFLLMLWGLRHTSRLGLVNPEDIMRATSSGPGDYSKFFVRRPTR